MMIYFCLIQTSSKDFQETYNALYGDYVHGIDRRSDDDDYCQETVVFLEANNDGLVVMWVDSEWRN